MASSYTISDGSIISYGFLSWVERNGWKAAKIALAVFAVLTWVAARYGTPTTPLSFSCLIIEGFFVAFHWAFPLRMVRTKLPYRAFWMKMAFIFELIPLIAVHFVTDPVVVPFKEPFGWPVWWILTWIHLAAHLTHAPFAIFKQLPYLHRIQQLLLEIVGLLYVTFLDAPVHTVTAYRFMTIANPYEWLFSIAFWVVTLTSLDHRFFYDYEYKDWPGERPSAPVTDSAPVAESVKAD